MTEAQRLKDLLEAFNAHDLDRIMAFFADDCVLETPRGSQPWGTRFVAVRRYERVWGSVLKACRTCTTARTSTGHVVNTPSPGGC